MEDANWIISKRQVCWEPIWLCQSPLTFLNFIHFPYVQSKTFSRFLSESSSITNHWYRCKSVQWEQFSLNDIGFLQSTGTCPRCVQWKNSHPRKTPECHREAAGAGAGPDPGTKSSPHLLNKTILYNPVYAPTNVSRAFPNQHLRMGTVW